jgi:DNA processing protein
MAADIAGGVSDEGWCVVSGGAYGIDAAAHRAALTGSTPTVAVMAGGVDRLYPAGHTDLLTAVLERGAVVSEVPVGFAPHRQRFLSRNRLIATAAATCVVEAAARSGALSTVNHALQLGRPVGAVPGPVTSTSSRGCHALIRDGAATLVTGPRDVLELAGPIAVDPERDGGDGFGDPHERAAFDAIAARGSRVDAVAMAAGLTVREAMAALGGLELAGKAAVRDGVWHRAKIIRN